MTEAAIGKSGGILDGLVEMGKDIIARHPHSLTRSISAGAGWGSAVTILDSLGAVNPDVPHAAAALYLLTPVVALVSYKVHEKKEEANKFHKQAHPDTLKNGDFKNGLKKLWNTASEYTMTGVAFAGGVAASAALGLGKLANDTIESLGMPSIGKEELEIGAAAGFVGAALNMLEPIGRSAKQLILGADSLESQMARNQRIIDSRNSNKPKI